VRIIDCYLLDYVSGTGKLFLSWPLYILPHHLISRVIFHLTRWQGVGVTNAIQAFSRLFGVDLNDALHTSAADYQSFNAFFTRELKPGARPLDQRADGIASPVDGRVSQLGNIDNDRIYQAKGHDYTLQDLLGKRDNDTAPFIGGRFATLYLSPRDYHRIHMPLNGNLCSMHYLPGRLFSVAPHTVRVVPRLFARNERVVALFDTPAGKLAMVLANSTTAVYRDYDEDEVSLLKGQEMGRFNMGSTVILLTEPGCEWSDSLQHGSTVRMGELIGQFS